MIGNLLHMLHQRKTLLLPRHGTGTQAQFLHPSALNCLTALCTGIAALWHGRAFARHKQEAMRRPIMQMLVTQLSIELIN